MTAKLTKSVRAAAWRNAMVAAINAGLERGVFTLDWGDGPETRATYPLQLAGTSFTVAVQRCGHWGELYFDVFVDGERMHASGWLERSEGKWLQVPSVLGKTSLSMSRKLQTQLAAAEVEPRGYESHGQFII